MIFARRAAELLPSDLETLDTLADAYVETGQCAEAMQTAHKALDIAKQQSKPALAGAIQSGFNPC